LHFIPFLARKNNKVDEFFHPASNERDAFETRFKKLNGFYTYRTKKFLPSSRRTIKASVLKAQIPCNMEPFKLKALA
jgi:hypothetical protein